MSFLQIFFLGGMSPVPFQNGQSEKRTTAATSINKPHGPWRNNIKEPLIKGFKGTNQSGENPDANRTEPWNQRPQ
jgi:hypothetical protein